MFRNTALVVLFATISANAALAAPEYDREKNAVVLSTPLLSKMDNGWITIYNEQHIEVKAIGRDDETGKMATLCGIKPSLGLLFKNGVTHLELAPNVTEVVYGTGENAQQMKSDGWVERYVLRGDDALDLMDLMLTNESIGFGVVSSDCKENEYYSSGHVTITFETKGLERVMKRIK